MAYQTAFLFKLPHSFSFYSFVFLGTVCSYNFHWALTPELFQNPILQKRLWNRANRKLHFFLAALALLLAMFFFMRLRQHWTWLAGAMVLAFLYSAPKIPWPAMQRLKRIAYDKTVFLALSWTYVTTILPLLISGSPVTAAHLLFCTNRFYFIYVICILFDLRDREADRQEGIKTMVTQFDLPSINRLYWGSIAVFFCTALALLFHFPIPSVVALLLPGLVLAARYRWFKENTSDYVYYILLDGLMIFSLPLLLLFRF
jgi:1,4-dihydroxy-2-naphthoate octaprenyltransferase